MLKPYYKSRGSSETRQKTEQKISEQNIWLKQFSNDLKSFILCLDLFLICQAIAIILINLSRLFRTMDFEMTEMEDGKAVTLSTVIGDNKSKIKQLKAKKLYNQLYDFVCALPPTKDKFLLKASTLMNLKRWKEAIEACDRGLDLEEESEFYNIKGRALGKMGEMKLKEQYTRRAIDIDSTVPVYYRNLGAALYKQKRYQEAMEQHQKAIQLEPHNSLNYHNLGAAYFRLQNYERAKQNFQKAIEKNRKEPLSHSWLGDCYKKTGELKKAIECYTNAYQVSGKQFYKEERDQLQKELNPKKGFFSKLFS